MKALLSIKPEYADKIFLETKRYEFRKVIFKSYSITTVIVYASSPISMVIGEFEVSEILSHAPEILWEKTMDHAGVDKIFYDKYFAGRDIGHAIKVENPKKYEEARSLSEFDVKQAPQSFVYINPRPPILANLHWDQRGGGGAKA